MLWTDREPELALREWHEAALANEVEVAVQANLAIAQVALQQGREPESLTALRQVVVLAPSHPLSDVLALNRGLLLVRGKDYAAAIQELQPLTPRLGQPFKQPGPGGMVLDLQPVLRRALGIARYHLGQFDLAEREFERARQLAPAEPSHYLGEGLAALAQSRFAQADRALTTARLAASPDIAVPATYALVLSADGRRDGDLFRERATGFVDRYPSHPYTELLLYRLVRQAVERRELERAESWTRRLVRDQPASDLITDAWLLVAEASVRDRPALARQAYGELLGRVRDPESRSAAWLGLAEAAYGLRDVPEAQRALEGFLAEAPPEHPRAAEALLLLVQAYDAQGQRDRTLAMTDAFLARYPQHARVPDIQLRRGYLLLVTQQWDTARGALEVARDGRGAGGRGRCPRLPGPAPPLPRGARPRPGRVPRRRLRLPGHRALGGTRAPGRHPGLPDAPDAARGAGPPQEAPEPSWARAGGGAVGQGPAGPAGPGHGRGSRPGPPEGATR